MSGTVTAKSSSSSSDPTSHSPLEQYPQEDVDTHGGNQFPQVKGSNSNTAS